MSFFENFDGNNDNVSLAFADSFDRERATVGNLNFRLSQDNLAQIVGLP